MNDTETGSREPGNDNGPEAARSLGSDFVMAMRFYSRLPMGRVGHQPLDLSRIAPALPFASLAITLGPALVLGLLLGAGMPVFVAAALAVAVHVMVTGAMAEDGLADSFDGLFGGASPEARLAILKDSRHGTYGVAALCLFLVARVGALASLAALNPFAAMFCWLAASVFARSAALWLTIALPPARRDGASAAAGQPRRHAFFGGLAIAAILGFVLSAPIVGIVNLVLLMLLLALATVGWTVICRRLVGGQTGDMIGALTALLEIVALSAFILA